MDYHKILDQLRTERGKIEDAIRTFEHLASGQKRRGRPPAWRAAMENTPGGPKRRGRPPGSKNKGKEQA